jgi:4-hydroxybenzoate polyprenyltransferase
VSARTRRSIALLFDYSRGRQALLNVAQPVLAALIAGGGLPPARTAVLGMVGAVAGFLCVFAANDLFDLAADREELRRLREAGTAGATQQTAKAMTAPEPGGRAGPPPDTAPHWDMDVVTMRHPLAAGALPVWAGVAWVTTLGAVALACAYALSPACALVFAICVALEALYCSLKRRSWLKTIPAGVMVGLGGLAGWLAVAPFSAGAVAFFLLFTVWEIAGRNLSNDLADVGHDAPLGIRTVAAVHGPVVTALAILAGALLMPVLAAMQTGAPLLRLALVAVSVWLLTLPALRLWSLSGGHQAAQVFFNRASLYPAVALSAVAVALLAA